MPIIVVSLSIGDRNAGLERCLCGFENLKWKTILTENLSFMGMLEPHISPIQQCQSDSNVYNIKGDIVLKKLGPLCWMEYV